MIGTDAQSDFVTHLVSELLKSSPRREFDNVDLVRFPSPASPMTTVVKNKLVELAANRGFYRTSTIDDMLLSRVLKTPGLADAYGLLEDEASRVREAPRIPDSGPPTRATAIQ
jgi:hypothetical protein